MDKILITGTGGFVGRRAADWLSSSFAVVTPSHRELDITNMDTVRSVLQAVKPTVVFHCAAISAVDVCESNPELAERVNVEGTLNVVRGCREIGAKCIVCSSDQVYMGSNGTEPHREWEVLNPSNVYGRGKLRMERIGLEMNPDSVYLRLTWMFDSRTCLLGEHSDFLRTVLSKLESGESISCAVSDYRGFTDVNEVIQNLPKVFTLPGGVYNYGSSNDRSAYTLLRDVLEQIGCPVILNPEEYAYRNLTIATDKIEQYGIHFCTSYHALMESMCQALHRENREEIR